MYFDTAAFECVTTKVQLMAWIKRIKKLGYFCYDTETTGLDLWRDRLVGHALAVVEGDRIDACYIPTGHTVGRQLDNGTVLSALAPLLQDRKINVVMANAPFDMNILRQPRYDIHINNADDTQRMSYVLDGTPTPQTSHGMDALAKKHLNYKTVKYADVVQERLGHTNFADVRLSDATHYSAEDASVTMLLAKVLEAKLKAAGLWGVYTDIDRPLIQVLVDMKQAGVLVDVKEVERLDAEFKGDLSTLGLIVNAAAGRRVNPASNDDCAKVMFDEKGFAPVEYGKTGKPSVDKFTLEVYAGDEFADALKAYRAKSKLRSSFTTPLPKKVNTITGRVHPDFADTRTITGRFACSNPNEQQIPVRTDDGMKLRAAHIAEKGMTLVGCDYSQIELRVATHLAMPAAWVYAYEHGIDVHTSTAATIRGLAIDDVQKKDRAYAKTANFLGLFGGGGKQLARQVKIPEAEAYTFIDDYWQAVPELRDYIDEVSHEARRNGFAMTMFGRRVPLIGIHSKVGKVRGRAERQAFSVRIQGSAADLMRLAMPRVNASVKGFGGRLILTVHDELLAEVPEKKAEAVSREMARLMETAADHLVKWRIPIIAEPKIGKTWAEAH